MKKKVIKSILSVFLMCFALGCAPKTAEEQESAGAVSDSGTVSDSGAVSDSGMSEEADSHQAGGWEIVQYGPREINSGFYTIYKESEGLIVIDGGWTEDAPYVREVIESYGNCVSAWILTHPHQDHVGAFNAIYADKGEMEIGQIYTVPMAEPEEVLRVAPWDSAEAYLDFLELEIPDLQYLHAGDKLELCGLEMEVLSSFDDNVRTFSKDYLNDGSLMFKISGAKESFLFCADVGAGMSDYLLQTYQEKLQADYLQMGHHGNGGLKEDFYRLVSPKAAFFDAPDWLMYDTTGKYDTPEKVKLMQSLGSEIFSFGDGSNTIILE